MTIKYKDGYGRQVKEGLWFPLGVKRKMGSNGRLNNLFASVILRTHVPFEREKTTLI